jgi:hypothetical protein
MNSLTTTSYRDALAMSSGPTSDRWAPDVLDDRSDTQAEEEIDSPVSGPLTDPVPDPAWDRVTQASWESFPASDAPGWG